MMNFVKSAFEDADFDLYGRNREQDLKDEAFFNKIINAKNSSTFIIK
jgi:GTP-binding protein Era